MKMTVCDRCGKTHDSMYTVEIRRSSDDRGPCWNAFEIFADPVPRTIDLCKPCILRFLDDVEGVKSSSEDDSNV